MCKACDCSNNWDSTAEGNCDPHTGECLKCLFFTEGSKCERCQEGYWGDAVNSQCNECTCNVLGTDPERLEKYNVMLESNLTKNSLFCPGLLVTE